MKINTYQIIEDEKKLVYQELYDKSENLIHYIDHTTKPKSKKKYKYNDNNLMIEEIELNDNNILNTITFDYNTEGKLINQKLFFGKSLFEETTISYNNEGLKKTIFQDGEEILRTEKNENGKNSTIKFFDNKILTEMQICEYNSPKNSSEINLFDGDKNLIGKRVKEFDTDDNIVKFQEFDNKNNLLSESVYEFKNKLMTKETYRDYIGHSEEFIFIKRYDENKNITLTETRTLTNDLLEFHRRKYNSKNKLIEESGFSRGDFDSIYGTSLNNEEFHFIHEYVDINSA